jgi:hypothetical protein
MNCEILDICDTKSLMCLCDCLNEPNHAPYDLFEKNFTCDVRPCDFFFLLFFCY